MTAQKSKTGVHTLFDSDQKQQPPVVPTPSGHRSVPQPASATPQPSDSSYSTVSKSIMKDITVKNNGDFDISAEGPNALTEVDDIVVDDDAKFVQKAKQGQARAGKVKAGNNFKFNMIVDGRPLPPRSHEPEQPKSSITPTPSSS